MLYFAYGAPYYLATAASVRNIQYVMGAEPEDIHRTFLLRDRYYRMLNDGVVDLFKEAKDHAEDLYDRHLPTGAHADRKSTRLNSSHVASSYAVFCLQKKKKARVER